MRIDFTNILIISIMILDQVFHILFHAPFTIVRGKLPVIKTPYLRF